MNLKELISITFPEHSIGRPNRRSNPGAEEAIYVFSNYVHHSETVVPYKVPSCVVVDEVQSNDGFTM